MNSVENAEHTDDNETRGTENMDGFPWFSTACPEISMSLHQRATRTKYHADNAGRQPGPSKPRLNI